MKSLFTFLLIGITTITLAQKVKYSTKNKKAIAAFEKARIAFDRYNFEECEKEIEKALKLDEKFMEAYMLKGYLAMDKNDPPMAEEAFKKVTELSPNEKLPYYNLAQAQIQLKKFSEAEQNLEKFINLENRLMMKEKAKRLLEEVAFKKNAYEHPVPFKPINLGDNINTKNDEFHPTISVDGSTLIYTGLFPKQSGELTEDIFYNRLQEDGAWGQRRIMGAPISTPGKEGAQSLSPDGQTMFFTKCDSETGVGRCDIYYAKWQGNKWGEPQNIGRPVNSAKWDAQPCLSSDGRSLYFASTRGSSRENEHSDIYVSIQNEDGTWGVPQKLPFSTLGDEMSPFIHPDGKTLYFASDGLVGMGKSDLYVVRMNDDGTWGKPENLGYPINTEDKEHGMIVDSNGELAYFASVREDGKGGLDIYSFELYEKARPKKVTYTRGKVFDAETKKPLSAKFELIDLETSKTIVESRSDEVMGEFLVCVPVNKDYALEASKEGYMFFSENYSLKQKENGKPYVLNVPMQPIKVGSSVVLNNVFFETAKFDLKSESKTELNKLVEFLNKNSNIKIELGGHTDNVGNESSNQILSENRAKSVKEYLISKGIPESRLSYKGYGATKPIATNDTEEGRAKNRRTEFKIISLD